MRAKSTGRNRTWMRGVGLALVVTALPLTGCTGSGADSTPSPSASPSASEEAGPLADPQVRITFEWEGEEHEVRGEPTQPICDEGGYINVIGGDSQSSTGVTLRLDEEGGESFVAAWVGADDFAAAFQGEGEVTVTDDGDDTLLSVTGLSGTVTAAARESGSGQSFNDDIEGGERVDGTLSFAVRCPNP